MRIRLVGTQKDVDIASEVMCVLFSVSNVATYPSEHEGQIMRYFMVKLEEDALTEQGLLLPTDRFVSLFEDVLISQ